MASSEDTRRVREFREVLYDALAGDRRLVRDQDPLAALRRAIDEAARAARASGATDDLAPTIDSLQRLASESSVEAAAAAAAALFESPGDLGEAIYLLRCLARDPASLTLFRLRSYASSAPVPESLADLATDRRAVLDTSLFSLLWRESNRLDWMQGNLELWRRDYIGAYLNSHATYNRSVDALVEQLDAIQAQAGALEKLNGLQALGTAVALRSLQAYRDSERLFPCGRSADSLAAALLEATRCPDCGYGLGDSAPVGEAHRTSRAVSRGLELQLGRLARRLAARIIRLPHEGEEGKIDQFLKLAQASDLAGLALVLDADILAFLEGLLAMPTDLDVLDELSRLFPVVTRENLEAAVAEFRRLLESGLSPPGPSSVALRRGERSP